MVPAKSLHCAWHQVIIQEMLPASIIFKDFGLFWGGTGVLKSFLEPF